MSIAVPLRPRGQAARWCPGSQGTQLPSHPISKTNHQAASDTIIRVILSTDGLTSAGVTTMVDLWRCAVSRGHCGVMLHPLPCCQQQQQQQHYCYCLLTECIIYNRYSDYAQISCWWENSCGCCEVCHRGPSECKTSAVCKLHTADIRLHMITKLLILLTYTVSLWVVYIHQCKLYILIQPIYAVLQSQEHQT